MLSYKAIKQSNIFLLSDSETYVLSSILINRSNGKETFNRVMFKIGQVGNT